MIALAAGSASYRAACRHSAWPSPGLPSWGRFLAWSCPSGARRPQWPKPTMPSAGSHPMLSADAAYKAACGLDRFYSLPWLHYASLYENDWLAHGAKPKDDRLKKISFLLDNAVNPPRNPYSWAAHRQYAGVIAVIVNRIGSELNPRDLIRYRGKIVGELRKASRLNPTNATLHADLAEASANISMFRDAAAEAEAALSLDRITPHPDKKLADEVRTRLMARLPEWKDQSAQNANLDAKP